MKLFPKAFVAGCSSGRLLLLFPFPEDNANFYVMLFSENLPPAFRFCKVVLNISAPLPQTNVVNLHCACKEQETNQNGRAHVTVKGAPFPITIAAKTHTMNFPWIFVEAGCTFVPFRSLVEAILRCTVTFAFVPKPDWWAPGVA